MFSAIHEFFFRDLARIYRLLNAPLRRRVRRHFVKIFVLGVLEASTILVISLLAMSFGSPEAVLRNSAMRRVCDFLAIGDVLAADPRYVMLATAIGAVVFLIVRNVFSAYATADSSKLSEEIGLFFGDKLLCHFLYSSYLWHLGEQSGKVIRALKTRILPSQTMFNLMSIYTYVFIALMMFVLLVSSTPLTVLAVLLIVVLLSFAIYKAMKRKIEKARSTSEKARRLEAESIENARNGIREIIIYQQQTAFFAAFAKACGQSAPALAFLNIAAQVPKWILEVLGFAVIPAYIVVMVGVYNAPQAEMSRALIILLLACWRVLPLFSRSLSLVVRLQQTRPRNTECLEILESCRAGRIEPSLPAPDFGIESVALENASFHYEDDRPEVLRQVSIQIRRGAHVGIVGPSGSGKSTLVDVLSGLLAPESGAFLVNGRVPTFEELLAYRLKVGYVPQTPYIMPGTVAANVAFSEWERTIDEERVALACEMAALDVVHKHPKGIYRPIGAGGAGLSGGQIQRIAIARALYTVPEVLLMDEATSSLDLRTEAAIVETINALRDKLTVITVAHRLTTVEKCQIIYVLDDGAIIDAGPPADILPRYRERMLKESPSAACCPNAIS